MSRVAILKRIERLESSLSKETSLTPEDEAFIRKTCGDDAEWIIPCINGFRRKDYDWAKGMSV